MMMRITERINSKTQKKVILSMQFRLLSFIFVDARFTLGINYTNLVLFFFNSKIPILIVIRGFFLNIQ